jgi:hypothetical protein
VLTKIEHSTSKTTRSFTLKKGKNFIVWQEVLDQEKERRKSSPIFPKTKTCPNKLLQEREKSGDDVHNKRTFTLSLSLLGFLV